jgi:Response regulator containing CheY-like receiver domain and AraC-type DNA-binding domain
MMYKVIIADDERNIREGLADLINWTTLGFEVVARLEDGREALEYIDKMPVDVVLTDIKMTFVSGLELARYILEHKLDIKVVIISGHKEFEFAKQAISLGVVHYLLKPTRLNEINSVFRNIKLQLDQEKEEKEKVSKITQHYEEIIPFMQEQFFIDLLMGALQTREEINRRISLAGLNIEPEEGQFFILNIKVVDYDKYLDDTWEYGKDGFFNAMKNFLKSEGDILYYPVYQVGNSIHIFAMYRGETSREVLEKRINQHFDEIKTSIKDILSLDISVEISFTCNNLHEIALFCKSVSAFNGNSTSPDNETSDKYDYLRLKEQQKLFISHINAGNIEAVNNLLDSFILTQKNTSIKAVHNFIIDLFAILCNKLRDIGIDIGTATHGCFSYDAILGMKNIAEIDQWCRFILKDIMEFVSQCREASEKNVIRKAKDFINENYNRDISLEDVGDFIFLSPVYLSRLFKMQTGENFVDYLTGVRMEKAMELLEDPRYKAYEVSSMVGYKGTKYFFKLFKEYTGYTPTEYRKNLLI